MPSRSVLLVGLLPLLAVFYTQYFTILSLLLPGSYGVPLPRSKTPIVMASTPAFRLVTLVSSSTSNLTW